MELSMSRKNQFYEARRPILSTEKMSNDQCVMKSLTKNVSYVCLNGSDDAVDNDNYEQQQIIDVVFARWAYALFPYHSQPQSVGHALNALN